MPLQEFRSTDVGAPVMKGTAGAVTDLLDACLVNGYATLSVTSISAAGAVVLAVANATLKVLDYITFSGATGGDASIYNTACRITAVTDSTHVTVALPSTPSGAATGTLLYKKSPLGYSIAYTGTNKRAYRADDVTGNRLYLRVDDATLVNVRECYARGYETMSDIDTGTGGFPTAAQMTNGVAWHKSSTADSTSRAWTLIGDGKYWALYVTFINGDSTTLVYSFGDIIAYKPGDAFATIIVGTDKTNITAANVSNTLSGIHQHCANGGTASVAAGIYIARKYDQTGTAVACSSFDSGRLLSGNSQTAGMATAGLVYPNGPDGGLHVAPIEIIDHTGAVFHKRGRVPGLYAHIHSTIPQTHYDELTGVTGLSGVKLRAIRNQWLNNLGAITITGLWHVDVTGPWA